jgi:2-oxoglutarate dehydrogenase E2 component (dihydrolipoamide succinyltransferase)
MEVRLPKLGESILSATVVRWFKKVGDSVRLDEPLLEVSTDKVTSEIPSPVAGVLQKILVDVSQEVPVGALLAVIDSSAEAIEPAPKQEEDFFTPAVLRLLSEKGISLSQAGQIPRERGGRLTKQDVEAYLEAKEQPTQNSSHPHPERVKMTALRKAIADNMVRSFYEAPHASLISEVDVTNAVNRIKQEKQRFLEQHGAKLTISSFIARAISRAIQAYPLINSSLTDGDTIVVKRSVNLGIAVSVDQGVIVPVIHGCQALSLAEIARRLADLAEKARSNRLSHQDVQEGSITMTNFGMAGALMGTPIIRYPEVAIVGIGAINKRVVVLEDDSMAIRSIMMVSLTFDHRVLDGLYGCGFLSELKRHLEEDSDL